MRAAALILVLVLAGGARAGKVHLGADVSSLPCVEAGGAVFSDGIGQADALAILARHGVDRVRIRLWHTPADGRSGAAEAIALAARARRLGLGVLLDIHYSDTWADPGHQAPPAAWRGLTGAVLEDSVRIYTRDTLRRFAAAGAAPDWVQLGNEISAGLLWSSGQVGGAFDTPAQWNNLAALLQAAIAGVDEALPSRLRPAVLLHTDQGGDPAAAVRFFDTLAARGVTFDLIGLSYYPWWHGSLDDLNNTVSALAARFAHPLWIVETAYPWTLDWFDDQANIVGRQDQLLRAYPAQPEAQGPFLDAVTAIAQEHAGPQGASVFWWEPAWIPTKGCGSPCENLTLFTPQGRLHPSLDSRPTP